MKVEVNIADAYLLEPALASHLILLRRTIQRSTPKEATVWGRSRQLGRWKWHYPARGFLEVIIFSTQLTYKISCEIFVKYMALTECLTTQLHLPSSPSCSIYQLIAQGHRIPKRPVLFIPSIKNIPSQIDHNASLLIRTRSDPENGRPSIFMSFT